MNPHAEDLFRGAMKLVASLQGAAAEAASKMIEVALALECQVEETRTASRSRQRASRASRSASCHSDISNSSLRESILERDLRGGPGESRQPELPFGSPPAAPEPQSVAPAQVATVLPPPTPLADLAKRAKDARQQPVALDEPLPPELAAVAEREGVTDPVTCWRKFTAYYAGKRIDRAATWLRWCLNERNRAPPSAPASETRLRVVPRARAPAAPAAPTEPLAGPGLVSTHLRTILAGIRPATSNEGA